MNKESNKLLAEFIGVEVEWNDLYDEWMLYEYDWKPFLWKPASDWNQLHLVIDEFKSTPSLSKHNHIAVGVLDIPIGYKQEFIYNKVVNAIKFIMNKSTVNSEEI